MNPRTLAKRAAVLCLAFFCLISCSTFKERNQEIIVTKDMFVSKKMQERIAQIGKNAFETLDKSMALMLGASVAFPPLFAVLGKALLVGAIAGAGIGFVDSMNWVLRNRCYNLVFDITRCW